MCCVGRTGPVYQGQSLLMLILTEMRLMLILIFSTMRFVKLNCWPAQVLRVEVYVLCVGGTGSRKCPPCLDHPHDDDDEDDDEDNEDSVVWVGLIHVRGLPHVLVI